MYAQLGNIIFDRLKAFGSYSETAEEAFAQHDRMNNKPSLEHTGSGLLQLELSTRFHISFCNPSQELNALHNAKQAAEILPFIYGNGEYKGDFVITAITVTHEFSDKEGTLLSCAVNFTLLEVAAGDRVYQQEQAARKNALAVGEKRLVTTPRVQLPTDAQQCAIQIGFVSQQGERVNTNISTYQDNISQRGFIVNQLLDAFKTMEAALGRINEYLDRTQSTVEYSPIVDGVNVVRNAISSFQFPVNDVELLKRNNTYMQSVLRGFKRVCTPLLKNVAIRAQ